MSSAICPPPSAANDAFVWSVNPDHDSVSVFLTHVVRTIALAPLADVGAAFRSDGNTLAREPLTGVLDNVVGAFPNLLESVVIRAPEGFVAIAATDRLLRVTVDATGAASINPPLNAGDPGGIVRIPLKTPDEMALPDPDATGRGRARADRTGEQP